MVVVVVVGGSVMMIGGLGVLGLTGVPSEDKLDYTGYFLHNCKGLNIGLKNLCINQHLDN